MAQQDGAPALPAGGVGRDRGESIPALAREVARGPLHLAGAAMADGPQAQGAARLVDAPGFQLDGADALRDGDQRARAFAEPVERDGESALAVAVAGDQGEQAVDVVAAHLGLADEVRHEPAIGRRVEQHAAGGPAVASGTAGLLVVGLERRRQGPVPDGAHVGLVDAHAEGGRRHHDAVGGSHEAPLARVALGRAEPRVVGLGGQVGVAQPLRDVLAARPRAGVDDRGPLRRIGQPGRQQCQARALALHGRHVEGKVGPVDTGAHLHRIAQPQRSHDVGCDARRGGRGECHRAARADRIARVGEPEIVGTEIVPPLAEAVRFVHGEERDPAPVDGCAETSVAEALRRHEHEPA